jgi:hemerythrin superfamily protein
MDIRKLMSRVTSSGSDDAVDLLSQDHTLVIDLFRRYECLDHPQLKQALLSRIIRVLAVHLRIEEELFYPALREAIGDRLVMEEADVEHALIRKLMADLYRSGPNTSHFEAKVRSLAYLVEYHVEEEESQMLPEARASNLNLFELRRQLDAYRAALESRYDLDADGTELAAYLCAPTVLGGSTTTSTPRSVHRPPAAEIPATADSRRPALSESTHQDRH